MSLLLLTIDNILEVLEVQLRRLLPTPISIGGYKWIDGGRRLKLNVLGCALLRIRLGPDESPTDNDADAMRISILDCAAEHHGIEVSYSFATREELVASLEHYFQTNNCVRA